RSLQAFSMLLQDKRGISMNRRYRIPGFGLSLLMIFSLILPLRSYSNAAEKRMITEMDLFKFVWPADPQISPDVSLIVYTRVWIAKKTHPYQPPLLPS